jgi:hypothetical protein
MKLASGIIFVLAFTIRVALVLIQHEYLQTYPPESVRVARSIEETGVFGNPWVIPTGPTAQIAPFQPYLISLVYRVFGEGTRGELARNIVGCAVSSMIYAALPYAAAALGLPLGAGAVAGGIGAFLPLKFHTEVNGAWESPWAALAMILVITSAAARLRLAAVKPQSGILDGAFWGIGMLISPGLLPVLVGVIAVEGYRFLRCNAGRYVTFLALRLAVIVLLLTPWTIRNYRTFGAVCPVRCSFGLEFFTGNNPQAHLQQTDNFWSGAPHPTVNPAECLHLMELGETAYNREKLRLAEDAIKAQPGRFLYFTAGHFVLFWLSWTPSLPAAAVNIALSALGLAGMIMLMRAHHPAVSLILSVWITFPLVYYIIQFSTKYRYPIDWTLLLLAGVVIWRWAPRRLAVKWA